MPQEANLYIQKELNSLVPRTAFSHKESCCWSWEEEQEVEFVSPYPGVEVPVCWLEVVDQKVYWAPLLGNKWLGSLRFATAEVSFCCCNCWALLLFVWDTGWRRSPYLQHVVLMAKGSHSNVVSLIPTSILLAKASYMAKPWVQGTGCVFLPSQGSPKLHGEGRSIILL